MIEIEQVQEPRVRNGSWPRLQIDGNVTNKGVYTRNISTFDETDLFTIIIDNSEAARKVLAHRFSDLPKGIKKIEIYYPRDLPPIVGFYRSIILETDENDDFRALIYFAFEFVDWKQAWSPVAYLEELNDIFGKNKISGLGLETPPIRDVIAGIGPSFVFRVQDTNNPIEGEIRRLIEVSQQLHESTERSLASKFRTDSLVMNFDFPDEVKAPCEQYLVYFGEFLRDSGVKANASVTHEAGQILFTVTPDDKTQALD